MFTSAKLIVAEFEQSLSCNQHRLPAGPFSVFLEVEMPHGPEAI
jgi:hypothetical protein